MLVEVLAHGGGAADVRERVIAGVNRGKNGVDQLGLTHLLRDGRQNVSEAAAAVRTFALSQSGGVRVEKFSRRAPFKRAWLAMLVIRRGVHSSPGCSFVWT